MKNKTVFNPALLNRMLAHLLIGFTCIIWTPVAFAQEDQASADETAKKLANPAGSLANLANNIAYRTYKGDLPGAEEQTVIAYTFQPVLPFPVGDKGRNITFRPAFNVTFDQPVYNATDGAFQNIGTQLNDLTFDLVYAGNTMTDKDKGKGYLWGMGMAGTLPIATHDLSGGNQWRFGPELFGGLLRSWGTAGALVNNQFNVGGSSDVPFSTTSAQYFYGITLGDGWQILSAPVIVYDWKAESGEDLSLPLGTGIARTVKLGNTPWRFHLEFFYYVEQPDSFGNNWVINFDFRPVIKNPFVRKKK